MSKTDGYKRTTEELEKLAIEVATLFYEDQLSPSDIFSRLRDFKDVRSVRDIRLLLDRARDPAKPLISVHVTPLDSVVRLDEGLSEALMQRTPLRRAFVAKTGDLASGTAYVGERSRAYEEWCQEGDLLHKKLGVLAARYVWSHIRSGDTIGIASGRGPGYTVEALRQLAAAHSGSFRDLFVVSLAGGIARQADGHDRPWRLSIDADQRVVDLAESLRAERRLVQLPLFVRPPREDLIARTDAEYLVASEGCSTRLTIALFGFGVLDRGHYLLRPGTSHMHPEFNIVRDELDRLCAILESCPAPIIDVGQFFWMGNGVPTELRPQVQEIVDSLNSKVVVATPAVVNEAEERIAIGGGAQKFEALRQMVLHETDIHPTTVVTDEISAQRLLKELDVSPGSTPS